MIKLTIHESVEAALQKAFPKPAAAAKRALTKCKNQFESAHVRTANVNDGVVPAIVPTTLN